MQTYEHIFRKTRILATCKKFEARYKFPQRIDLTNGDHQYILQEVLQAVGTFKMKCIAHKLSILDPRAQLS